MPTAIITTDDLKEFKAELFEEIRELLRENQAKVIKKEWLKSTQVMDKLNISSGTLQKLRDNGTLSYTKIGGLIFYEADQIEKILMENLVQHSKDKK
ncbi:DNA-binding protein [Arenibacter aquaticus]|uniref:DNA-binding protein n=1 Tax=Arenibacter aquaticus TaxID=2489054 RepID=A0A3S0CPD6_9FLAO|nr:helix-turn-helix domain-containing protein [Arenibacter aquaticus]RTE54133.1 DNA-binding protein [Arenibacter aquaticus]